MKYLLLLTSIFFIGLISSLSCNPNLLNLSYDEGDSIPPQSITCTNSNNYSVTLYNSGSFFSTSPSFPLIINANSSSSFSLSFSSLSEGDYQGFLYSSDGLTLPIELSITSQSSPVIVFPTSKVVNIQQGATKSQTIQIIVPSNYPRQITIQSVSFNPDIDLVNFGDLDLGTINPGQTVNIPLIINAKDVQIGTYNTQVTILATDSNGQVPLSKANIQVVVSVGVTPATNSTFSTQPSCSLSSLEFNFNTTYTFICDNIVDNIEVNPVYNDYLEGVKAEYTSGKYTYSFKAKKLGSSNFTATFNYKGSPIFEAFIKNFRITPSGNSPVGGVDIELQFFQNGQIKDKDSLNPGSIVMIAIDNKSNNAIGSFSIQVNGVLVNNTFSLESDKNYYIRVTASGYNDLIINNLTTSKTNIIITLNPNKEIYSVGDVVNITTDVNGTLMFNEQIISGNNYMFTNSGEFILKSYKDGYLTTERNITISGKVNVLSVEPDYEKWKKNKEITILLSENVSWSVYYEEYIDKEALTFKEPKLITSSIGSVVIFKTEDYGRYSVKNVNDFVVIYTMDSNFVWYNPFSWGWIGWILMIGLGAFIIYFLFFRDSEEPMPGNYGGNSEDDQ